MVRETQSVDGERKEQAVDQSHEGQRQSPDAQAEKPYGDSKYYAERTCIFCGPRIVRVNPYKHPNLNEIVCPGCGFDAGTARAIQNVVELGFEECYKREVRSGR